MRNASRSIFATLLMLGALMSPMGCGSSVSTTKETPPGPKNYPPQDPAKK